MDGNEKQLIDELAQAVFAVMARNGRLKAPAAIAVMQPMSGGPRSTASRRVTVWQDYRTEARQILRQRT